MTTTLILMAIALKLRFAVPAEGPFRTPIPTVREDTTTERWKRLNRWVNAR